MTFDPGAVPPSDDPMADPAEAELQKRLEAARALLDGLRPPTEANVERFLTDDALEAGALLREHERMYFYRLTQALRPFNILRQWQAALGTAAKELADVEQKLAEKTLIIALADELVELWHDGAEAWCQPKEHGPGCCWRIPGPDAKRYLLAAYGERHQATLEGGRKAPMAPGRQSVAEALDQLEAMAHAGPKRPKPALRVGGDGARLVVDLCRDDFAVIVVEAGGWQVVKPSPIALRRAPGMLPLPLPVQGAVDALGDLRRLLHFDDAEHDSFWALFVGFMFAALRPVLPYFVLCVAGEQGTGKSMTAKTMRLNVDPHDTDIQPKPRTEDDLFVNGDEQWLVAYDNLSALDQHWSDAFCRISTGIGYAKRKLYTDRDTVRFRMARPQVITAIVDVVAAPDLLDRSLLAQQPEMTGDPVAEEELLAAATALVPRVLGQMLDAAAIALVRQSKVKLSVTPRMVGPTRWIEAGAEALGLEPEAFLSAYLDSQARAGELALDANLIGVPLRDMIDRRDTFARLAAKEGKPYAGPLGFSGPAKDLLAQLNEHIRAEPHPGRGWPRTPRGMSAALRRIAPALRKVGYGVEFRRTPGTGDRVIAIDTEYSRERAARSAHNANDRHDRHDRHTRAGDRDGRDGRDGRLHTQTNVKHSGNGAAAPGACAHCTEPIPPGAGYTATSEGVHLHNACVDAWARGDRPWE